MEQPEFNPHNKQEYPPMHTAEHILNATMVSMFACGRHVVSHVERTKSKLDYDFSRNLTPEEIAAVERRVNDVIRADLPVVMEYATQDQVAGRFNLERLPDGASREVRIVHVGDYDECLCVGAHVQHTAQIGHFRISSTRFANGRLRIVFRLDGAQL